MCVSVCVCSVGSSKSSTIHKPKPLVDAAPVWRGGGGGGASRLYGLTSVWVLCCLCVRRQKKSNLCVQVPRDLILEFHLKEKKVKCCDPEEKQDSSLVWSPVKPGGNETNISKYHNLDQMRLCVCEYMCVLLFSHSNLCHCVVTQHLG